MHHEAHDARGENVVLHVRVPCRPQLLEIVERDIVLGHLVELAPVCVDTVHMIGRGRVPVHLPVSRWTVVERKKERVYIAVARERPNSRKGDEEEVGRGQ
jgi:hypothetical protein